jgi:hypothetical protein
MGTWSPAVFGNDTANDIRDGYRELIQDGAEDLAAENAILQRYADDTNNPEKSPDIWIALAVSQSEVGRLSPAVAERALDMIEKGQGMALWLDSTPKLQARRRQALAKAEDQLKGPQPPRRKLRKPPTTSLRAGDVLAYVTREKLTILFRVARISRGRPLLVLLDYVGHEPPSLTLIARLKDHKFPFRGPQGPRVAPIEVEPKRGIDYEDSGYVLLGNIGARPGDEGIQSEVIVDWHEYPPGMTVVSKMLRERQGA